MASFCLVSCGKVTQEVAKNSEKVKKTFGVLFKIQVFVPEDPRLDPKSEIHKKETHQDLDNVILLRDEDTVIASVEGIVENQGAQRLSWGKIQFFMEDEDVTTDSNDELNDAVASENVDSTVTSENVVTANVEVDVKGFSAKSSNQYRLSITAPKYNDTYLSLNHINEHDLDKYTIQGKSVKLSIDYDLYVLKLFSGPHNYRLYVFDKQHALDVDLYEKSTITVYETFISILTLMALEKNDYILDPFVTASYAMFNRLYNPDFFELLSGYKLPKNKVKKFNEKNPIFVFDSPFESELVEIMTIILTGSKNQAKKYVDDSKKLTLNIIQKRFLKSLIDAFELPEQQVDDSDASAVTGNAIVSPNAVVVTNNVSQAPQ